MAAMGRDDIESQPEYERAAVGALMMAEALHELRLIRRLLTPPKE